MVVVFYIIINDIDLAIPAINAIIATINYT